MELKPGAHIHFMGICGTAMASLAGLLKEKGFKVTGSDQNVYPPMSTMLEDLGITIMESYKKENLSPRPDLVIVGNVIRKDYEEPQALLKSDIPYTSLPKALGEFLIEDRKSVVFSGTHGKTTMTSMMSWVLESSGYKPGFLVGGIPLNFNKSFQVPDGDYFVIEGDEYDTAFFDKVPKFIHYKPRFAVISSIEFDHIDIYPNLEAIKKAFKRLVDLVPSDGVLLINGDDTNALEVSKSCEAKLVSYGLKSGDYRAVEREVKLGRNQFCVEYKGEKIADIAMKQFGEHNTLNALGVFAMAHEMGVNKTQILQALANFKGVKRRQEVLGEFQGATLIEDFAHHPTAVSLTLKSMGEAYAGKRIIAVFEPRSATSRCNVFQKEYEQAFESADVSIVAQAFDDGRISEDKRFSTDNLIQALKDKGKEAYAFKGVEPIVNHLKAIAGSGDVVLVMSNGGFDNIYEKLLSSDHN